MVRVRGTGGLVLVRVWGGVLVMATETSVHSAGAGQAGHMTIT